MVSKFRHGKQYSNIQSQCGACPLPDTHSPSLNGTTQLKTGFHTAAKYSLKQRKGKMQLVCKTTRKAAPDMDMLNNKKYFKNNREQNPGPQTAEKGYQGVPLTDTSKELITQNAAGLISVPSIVIGISRRL
ncbi:Hypothetical predicted protein [Pelobates cultripes]|uniref:Uncharacterized protein n=1 Tax=Pelobates cultripes TaxID=61616 RepID=A0AAD1WGS6_PELCU|nr:Hypothetical predicted protein [Pelobates cultripes]